MLSKLGGDSASLRIAMRSSSFFASTASAAGSEVRRREKEEEAESEEEEESRTRLRRMRADHAPCGSRGTL